MKTEIMLAIADHLDTVKQDFHWYMGCWKLTSRCGTRACAIGHTVHLIPGLSIECVKEENDTEIRRVYTPYFSGLKGFRAVSEALEISYIDAISLFSEETKTPSDVASDIRKYVRENQ